MIVADVAEGFLPGTADTVSGQAEMAGDYNAQAAYALTQSNACGEFARGLTTEIYASASPSGDLTLNDVDPEVFHQNVSNMNAALNSSSDQKGLLLRATELNKRGMHEMEAFQAAVLEQNKPSV